MPTTALFMLLSFVFTTVMVLGAYTAADLHLTIPSLSLLSFDMHSLLMLTTADAFNTFLYVAKSKVFSVGGLMRWLLFTKVFFAAHLFVAYDDRWPVVAATLIVTTLASYTTARTIAAIISNREELKSARTIDLYVKMILDIGF